MRIAVDTNVLVRFLTWDDEVQASRAAKAMAEADMVVVPTVVLCEVVWVLRRAYRYSGSEVAKILHRLADSREIEIDRPATEAGLALLEAGGDFADGVILFEAKRNRCDHLVTFDRALHRHSAGSDVLLLDQEAELVGDK